MALLLRFEESIFYKHQIVTEKISFCSQHNWSDLDSLAQSSSSSIFIWKNMGSIVERMQNMVQNRGL